MLKARREAKEARQTHLAILKRGTPSFVRKDLPTPVTELGWIPLSIRQGAEKGREHGLEKVCSGVESLIMDLMGAVVGALSASENICFLVCK